MSLFKIQGKSEKQQGIYYEFDSDDEPLGVGGMGKVYKGRCVNEFTQSVRNVAIKFMYSDMPPYAIEKARREAAIHFRHDNLIEMLGFIETESRGVLGEVEHHYHVVSELLEGVSLDHLLNGKLVDQKGFAVPYAEKLYKDYQHDPVHFASFIVRNVLSGLASMHDAGYIHRDIDPTNIMITRDGHIKLIDFGIAKKYNSLTTSDKHLTQAGQFIGKPEYAAPELVLGAINEQNQTTDLYAVGILLFQCIVGHVPFEGDRSDILQKQLHAPLPLKLIKHKGMRRLIARATEKQRAKRFQSAAEFRVALDNVEDAGGLEWKPFYTYIASGAAACVLAVAGIVWALNGNSEDGHESIQTFTYDSALSSIHNGTLTEKRAVEVLDSLSQKDARASFLLSQLLFKSKLSDDNAPDSIKRMQQQLGIQTDNDKAHELLVKTVDIEPNNYKAAYELALDYWKADQRTDAVPARDGDRAQKLFDQAYKLASEAHDTMYARQADTYRLAIKQWRLNLKMINNYDR